MSGGLDSLLARRRELIARSDAHRDEIARCVDVWRSPLEKVDRAAEMLSHLRAHLPWLAAAGTAVWVATSGRRKKRRAVRGEERRLPGVLGKAQTAWQIARTVAGVASTVRRGSGWMA